MNSRPWAAFCISTYKRPEFLRKQLRSLLRQTFINFEIVVSDNDPQASAREVVLELKDDRVKYFHNGDNLGMIKSFNQSIRRSTADFVVMVTDDDPIEESFLSEIRNIYNKYPGHSLYAGFIRKKSKPGKIEQINKNDFVREILDPFKTPWLLWSSAILNREASIKVNFIPDYGSPHLADHALLAMVGSINGGIVVNRKFSSLTSHDSNFSKFNFDYYTLGCEGFYRTMTTFCSNNAVSAKSRDIIVKHLHSWFIANIFNLKRYYTVRNPNKVFLAQVNQCAEQILLFPFMTRIRTKFRLKQFVFVIKKNLGILK